MTPGRRPGDRYQQAFAGRFGVGHAFGFWKGRVALMAVLKGLGVGAGDEVVLSGYTCAMAVNPVVYVGARPVFVDIDPATYNMDPELVEAAVTPRTRAIIAQHTYGFPAGLDAIVEIASRRDVALVEDCCLALGSTYHGRLLGTFGRAAYFSFQWNKSYTTGLGGMAITDDDELAARIRQLCDAELEVPSRREALALTAQVAAYRLAVYPRTAVLLQRLFRALARGGIVLGSSETGEFTPRQPQRFFKGMSGFQARSGLRQLRRLDGMFAHRRRLHALYDGLLAERGWPVPERSRHADPVLVRYPVRVSDKERALATAGGHMVELGSWFESPLHPRETNLAAYGYRPGMCPEAERACRETVNLPLHPRADEATARRSVEFIARIGPAARK